MPMKFTKTYMKAFGMMLKKKNYLPLLKNFSASRLWFLSNYLCIIFREYLTHMVLTTLSSICFCPHITSM